MDPRNCPLLDLLLDGGRTRACWDEFRHIRRDGSRSGGADGRLCPVPLQAGTCEFVPPRLGDDVI